LLFIGGLGIVFALSFSLKGVISAILAMRILIQFIAQSVGVVLLRKRRGEEALPFKMWLYPVPVIISILVWSFVFVSTGWYAWWGFLMALAGTLIYLIKSKLERKS
jgi:amino acid transporter